MTRTWWQHVTWIVTLSSAAALVADEPNEPQAPAESSPASESAPADTGATGAAQPAPADDAEQTMQELMRLREGRPVVDPVRTPAGAVPENADAPDRDAAGGLPPRAATPTVTVDVDRSVLGVAPGQPQPTLRREGEFVVSRRGRLVRSPDGAHLLFVFEADSKESPEPPMILQPNQQLEAMENIGDQRGGNVEFIVSGQVHTYRGANYLLVTMMKTALDQGNLEN